MKAFVMEVVRRGFTLPENVDLDIVSTLGLYVFDLLRKDSQSFITKITFLYEINSGSYNYYYDY